MTLRDGRERKTTQIFKSADEAKRVGEQRIALYREIFFLQNLVDRAPEAAPRPATLASVKVENPNKTFPVNDTTPPPRPLRRRRKQYRRYLDEHLKFEHM